MEDRRKYTAFTDVSHAPDNMRGAIFDGLEFVFGKFVVKVDVEADLVTFSNANSSYVAKISSLSVDGFKVARPGETPDPNVLANVLKDFIDTGVVGTGITGVNWGEIAPFTSEIATTKTTVSQDNTNGRFKLCIRNYDIDAGGQETFYDGIFIRTSRRSSNTNFSCIHIGPENDGLGRRFDNLPFGEEVQIPSWRDFDSNYFEVDPTTHKIKYKSTTSVDIKDLINEIDQLKKEIKILKDKINE